MNCSHIVFLLFCYSNKRVTPSLYFPHSPRYSFVSLQQWQRKQTRKDRYLSAPGRCCLKQQMSLFLLMANRVRWQIHWVSDIWELCTNIQTTIQHTSEISFHNRQGSRLLPKTSSFSCILWHFQDYFSLLGWTYPTGDKQASSSPESIHIHQQDHGFEMRNTNLFKSSNTKLETWRKDWDFTGHSPAQRVCPEPKVFQTGQWNHNHFLHGLSENNYKKIN